MTREIATPFIDCRCFLGEGIVWWSDRRALVWTDIERSTLWMHDAAGARNWTLPKRLASFAIGAQAGVRRADDDDVAWPEPREEESCCWQNRGPAPLSCQTARRPWRWTGTSDPPR